MLAQNVTVLKKMTIATLVGVVVVSMIWVSEADAMMVVESFYCSLLDVIHNGAFILVSSLMIVLVVIMTVRS